MSLIGLLVYHRFFDSILVDVIFILVVKPFFFEACLLAVSQSLIYQRVPYLCNLIQDIDAKDAFDCSLE